MVIEHRTGKLHDNADGLSRMPCNQCGYFDDWDRTSVSTDHLRVIEVTDELAGDSSLRLTRDRRVPVWMRDYVPD
jgi:hypothetical protein